MVDLDRFKSVNDTQAISPATRCCGKPHAACARRRRYDSVGRYGGEEFLIVLPGCDAAGRHTGERLREAIAGAPFLSPGPGPGHRLPRRRLLFHCAPEVLVREADDALYMAKENGRNRVVVHCTELSDA